MGVSGSSNRRPDKSQQWWTLFEDTQQPHRRNRRRNRNRNGGLVLLGTVLVIGIGSGLLWFGFHTSKADQSPGGSSSSATHPPDPSALSRMQQLLPPGYSPQACLPSPASAAALATMTCGRNSDPGGPASTVFTVVGSDAAMQAVFAQATSGIANVSCPGNIRSPGPWRRKAAAGRINGILLCGFSGGVPAIAWTANDELMVSVVQADAQGSTLDGLYAWWLTHS